MTPEPTIVAKGYQLCALLTVCEQAARSLDNVPDGTFRDNVTNSLGGAMELAASMACDLLVFAEQHQGEVRKVGA